jgi:histidyl-tRNA synthetase
VQKLYYMGPQFRRERPQKGRYRQFYQIGAEALGPPSAGSDSPLRDSEIIEMLALLLDRVGIRQWQLQLNSVGCGEDRARYIEVLRAALKDVAPRMCADCQRRAVTNPLRVLDCKVPEDQPIIDALPKMLDYLDEDCRAHFQQVQQALTLIGVPFTINPRMVRGIDYYRKSTWEFTHGGLGAQSALLGGGRYDGLSEALGGPPAPGVGFALGLDRFVLALEAEDAMRGVEGGAKVYVAPLGAEMNAQAEKLARELREQGIAVELGDGSFRLKKSFETAERMGAEYVVIVGESEIASGNLAMKNIRSGEQSSIPRDNLGSRLR